MTPVYIYCQESPEWDIPEDEEAEAAQEREHQVIPLD